MAQSTALTPMDRFKTALSAQSVQEQFRNALQDNAPLFIASLIDIYGADTKLQKCAPAAVIMEALKAATLKLPINKNLGFAYIIPYEENRQIDGKWVKVPTPQFQAGYKAYIQLAMRTGQYRYLNADTVYEGENVTSDRITGALSISGEAVSEEVVGYFAYFETLNGFSKALYWTKAKVHAHAKRYSKSYDNKKSAWTTNPDEMCLKTVLKALLSKYGILSVEMVSAMTADVDEAELVQAEVDEHANTGPVVDVEPQKVEPEGEAPEGASGTAQEQVSRGPGF